MAVVVVVVLVGLGLWYSNQSPSAEMPTPVGTPPTAEITPVTMPDASNPAMPTTDAGAGQPATTPEPARAQPAAAPAPAAVKTPATPAAAPAELKVTTEPAKIVTVSYTGSTFTPASFSLKVGDTVAFVNNGSSGIRVSSNPHPAHTEHSEFDSRTLEPKATWPFTFTKAGTYSYHNHLNPGAAGSITVK